ncbi:MAG: DUF86 domain-containing protein [Vampirovibrionales bacterium]
MSRRYPELLLDDMLDCIATIETFYEGKTSEDIMASRLCRDAIIRNLEVLGEAANQLTPEIRMLAPEVPWRSIIALRNRLIHEYHGVNWKVVLPIVLNDLPKLKTDLMALSARIALPHIEPLKDNEQ